MATNVFFWEGCTVGLGILAGLFWYRRTGWSCGGMITPGLLALYSASPYRVLACLLCGLVLAPVLAVLSRSLGLYGRERVGAAMLLAIILRLTLLPVFPRPVLIGWVVPALFASDAERQGPLMTLCGAVSCAAAALFAVGLLRGVLV